VNYSKKKERRLIKNARKFEREEFGFDFFRAFTRRKRKGKKKYALFASNTGVVEPPSDFGSFNSFDYRPFEIFNNKNKAIKRKKELERRGYHTLLFRVITTSSSVTDEFLSKPPEVKLKVIFHEDFHTYLKKRNITIPYSINEAAAQVIGFYGTIEYAKKTDSVDVEDALKLREGCEKRINFVTKKRRELDEILREKEEAPQGFYEECTEVLKKYGTNIISTINNAFFVWYENYCKDYYLVASVFERIRNFRKFIDIISSLPEDYEEATRKLENLL